MPKLQKSKLEQETEVRKVFRTTMIIEAHDAEGFEWALDGAVRLARGHVMMMSFSKQGDPDTRVEVRTTRPRRRI